jgi:hypothetical protein
VVVPLALRVVSHPLWVFLAPAVVLPQAVLVAVLVPVVAVLVPVVEQ